MTFSPMRAMFLPVLLMFSCNCFRIQNSRRRGLWNQGLHEHDDDESYVVENEPMFSVTYDPLELPNQLTYERDLEDKLLERSLRFYDKSTMRKEETCYLVGLEDRSQAFESSHAMHFTLEESLTELSELAGAAGLTVVGSTYQRLSRPSIEYYIGQGKTKEIAKTMSRLRCTCVIFDAELTPSQQKNLEAAINQDNKEIKIKVVDRTALILDIFAQHARTREGQLQVQLALLSYRLPRLTNMWTHLERQSAGSKGRTSGGVGLRGPGETQLETDKRQMRFKISVLNRAIDAVRRHRSSHRRRRRQLGVPVVALVGYTNAGKSTLLNTFTRATDAFASDILFATLDPTTRLVRMSGMQFPDILMTDTVGFIQKLPTHLVAAFRATLEELEEADVLLHVSDVTNESWRKQECAVLAELAAMGLEHKPLVRAWNKIDLIPDRKEYWKYEATRAPSTVAVSCVTGEGLSELTRALQQAVCSQMEEVACLIPYSHTSLLHTLHGLGSLSEVLYQDEGVFVRGRLPAFLVNQVNTLSQETLTKFNSDAKVTQGQLQQSGTEEEAYYYESELSMFAQQVTGSGDGSIELEEMVCMEEGVNTNSHSELEYFDWTGLAKGRHSATARLSEYTKSSAVQSFAAASFQTVGTAATPNVLGTPASAKAKKETGSKHTRSKRNEVQKSDGAASSPQPSISSQGPIPAAQMREELARHLRFQSEQQQQPVGVSTRKAQEIEEYDLEKHGLCEDGLLDFDAGEYGHHSQ